MIKKYPKTFTDFLVKPLLKAVLCTTIVCGAVNPAFAYDWDGKPPAPSQSDLNSPLELPEWYKEKGWSWDRIQRYGQGIRSTKGWSDSHYDLLKQYDMLQLSSYDESKEMVDKLRELNSNITLLGYRNGLISYVKEDELNDKDNPNGYNDEDSYLKINNRRYSLARDFLLYDFNDVGIKNWWIRDVRGQHTNMDGVFIDGIAKVIAPYNPRQRAIGNSKADSNRYTRKFNGMLARTKQDTKKKDSLILGNMLRYLYTDASPSKDYGKQHMDAYLHGSYMEFIEKEENYREDLIRFINTCVSIGEDSEGKILCFNMSVENMHGRAKSRKFPVVDMVRAQASEGEVPGENIDTISGKLDAMRKNFEYKLGIFLICANKYSYFQYLGDNVISNRDGTFKPTELWFPEYPHFKAYIGAPKGPAVADKGNKYIFRRSFDGVRVILNINAGTARFVWKENKQNASIMRQIKRF